MVEVVGSISAVIGIIDFSIRCYNDRRKDLKLSETFEVVIKRLPVISDTLRTAQTKLEPIKDNIPEDVCDALEKVIDGCDDKARKLREIFEKVIPGEHDGWKMRYSKVIQRLGKGNTVEVLVASITQDVQLIVNHQAVNSATPEQNAKLEEIIKEMKSIKSSIPEEEIRGITFYNSGGGPQTNHVFSASGGSQTNHVYSGSGHQINHNATGGTQHFHSGKTSHDNGSAIDSV